MEILVDASAIIALIADEPEAEIVINCTQNAVIVSPDAVSFEIANGLTRMIKKKVLTTKEEVLNLMKYFKLIPLHIVEVNLEKALLIAWDYKIYAYDAFYLETASRLQLPLLTFDGGMRRIGKELGITILGG